MASCDDESNFDNSHESDQSASVQSSNDDEEDTLVVYSEYLPYQDEPIVDSSDSSSIGESEHEGEKDLDGLTPETLAARQDCNIPLNSW